MGTTSAYLLAGIIVFSLGEAAAKRRGSLARYQFGASVPGWLTRPDQIVQEIERGEKRANQDDVPPKNGAGRSGNLTSTPSFDGR